MTSVDMELKKHFAELQMQMQESRMKMRQLDMQIEQSKRNCQHGALTKREITTLPTETNCFETVGRMFVKRSVKEVEELIDGRVKAGEEKITALETSKKYLENNLKERENNLRELVTQKMNATKIEETK